MAQNSRVPPPAGGVENDHSPPETVGFRARSIDLTAAWVVLRRGHLTILAFLALGLSGGVIWGIFGAPIYEVSILTAPVEEEDNSAAAFGQLSGIANAIGFTGRGPVKLKDETIATARSRAFIYHFIDTMDALPAIFPPETADSWKSRLGLRSEATIEDAYDYFVNQVMMISEQRATGLVEIRLRWKDPETLVAWGTAIIDMLNEAMQRRAQQRAQAELDFLRKELERTESVGIRQAIFRLMEVQLKRLTLANVADDYALRVIDPPVEPDSRRPVSLSIPAKILLGCILGLLLGAFIVLASQAGRILGRY